MLNLNISEFNSPAYVIYAVCHLLIQPMVSEIKRQVLVPKCFFFLVVNFFYIGAMYDVERTAPLLTFPDEIDCVKFITISSATKEK